MFNSGKLYSHTEAQNKVIVEMRALRASEKSAARWLAVLTGLIGLALGIGVSMLVLS